MKKTKAQILEEKYGISRRKENQNSKENNSINSKNKKNKDYSHNSKESKKKFYG